MGVTPILSHFSPILAIIKKSVLTFLGGKFFFCKSAQKVVKFLKKIHCIFRHIREGVKPDMTFVTFFFFEGVPYLIA